MWMEKLVWIIRQKISRKKLLEHYDLLLHMNAKIYIERDISIKCFLELFNFTCIEPTNAQNNNNQQWKIVEGENDL